MKKEVKYDDKIIDCCVEDPEEKVEQSYENGHVKVHNIVDEECAILTAELIQVRKHITDYPNLKKFLL